MTSREGPSLLQLLTCGSVDDGKSTLIGRLLYDARLLLDDQLEALARDSRKHGTTSADLDLALLVDGLEAEREQAITIDVAYRYFATEKRRFRIADTPGHEQYTRNMATGASTSELAVLLVDATKGLLTQTRRHAHIVSLLGLRHVVIAVNKIDLVAHREDVFDAIVRDASQMTALLGFRSNVAIPLSARFGDNVTLRSERTPWYRGPTLLEHLETVDVSRDEAPGPFRLPVQWVNRPDQEFRGYSGTIVSGHVAPGDEICVARSGQASRVRRIVTWDGDLPVAGVGEAVTLVLDSDIDASCGDMFVSRDARPVTTDKIMAHLLWMADEELLPGRQYLLKCAAQTTSAQVTSLRHKIDVGTLGKLPARTLQLNEVGSATLALLAPIAFDPYAENRDTGGFILIDRFTNNTVAAGMIDVGLPRSSSVHLQPLDIDQRARSTMKGQRPVVVWFTGLSGAGKSTIANLVERALAAEGRHTYLLDGDNVRSGLNQDLGFSDADRVENIRRIGEVAKLFVDAGLIVLVACISPFHAEREMARQLVGPGQFVEAFVDTPLDVCVARDPKGLYRRAKAGEIKNLTGMGSPYEPPLSPELTLTTRTADAASLAQLVVRHLMTGGYLSPLAHEPSS